MTELPTPREIFGHSLTSLDQARSALSDARDWLRSDWEPVGSSLPQEAAQARVAILTAIGEAKDLIDAMKRDAYVAIESIGSSHR
jgi:hypothetical protein